MALMVSGLNGRGTALFRYWGARCSRPTTMRHKPRSPRPGVRSRKEVKAVSDANVNDGRKLRATGRTVQVNVNAKPHVKQAALKAAHKAGISLTLFIERALLAYAAELKRHA